MIIFSKILSPNDLGATGSHQAGLLIPKSCPLTRLILPHLRETENPRRHLEPFYVTAGERVECRLIYYNNKLRGGTRNEFRLTHVNWLIRDPLAQPGAILKFSMSSTDLIEVELLTTDGNGIDTSAWVNGWNMKGTS